MLLDRDMLIDGLTELGRRAAAAGKIIELAASKEPSDETPRYLGRGPGSGG